MFFNKTKKQNSKKNRLSILLILFLFVFNSLVFNLLIVKDANAVLSTVAGQAAELVQKAYGQVKDAAKWSWEKVENAADWAWKEKKDLQKHWAAVAFKASLHNFLNKLAIDAATYVASGDKGQKSMIFGNNWKDYMINAADEAAGTFIMTSAGQWDSSNANDRVEEDYWNCQEEAFDECYDWCEGDESPNECLEECEASYDCEVEYQDNLKNIKDKSPTVGSAGSRYSKGVAGSIVKFLCQPDFNVKTRITAGLAGIQRPRAPRCTASRAMRNWDGFMNDQNFLNNFQGYWNPEENDIGIALTMHSDFLKQKRIGTDTARKAREEGGGWKAVTDKVGNILTPGNLVHEALGTKPLDSSTEFENVFTENIIADAIATFMNTLISKMVNKWIMEGIAKVSDSDSSSSDYNWISGIDSSASRVAKISKGTKAAKARYSKIFQPNYKSGGAYSILEKLLICPDVENAGTTDCVITQPFADAIQQELTVQQAIDQGYINIEQPFGFKADGMEPLYNEGYPYRSLIILRKYRIIPVGWELAARYIGDFVSNSSDARIYNIQEIIDVFEDSSSPFYQLVDPNWVLKAPEVFCGFKGMGEKIISEEISKGIDLNNDGDCDDKDDYPPKINILREEYCADEKSCLEEDEKGNCLFYGYCSEEKRIWDFQGNKCEPYYNTCQSFLSPQGNQVFYLKNSVEYSDCSEDNVGCEWYCASRNPVDGAWVCLSQGWDLNLDNYCVNKDGCEIADIEDIDQDGDIIESCVVPYKGIECILDGSKARLTINKELVPNVSNDIYLNQKAESCSRSGEGCREYIRTKPNLGTNLITNSSFEDILETDIVDDVVADTFTSWTSTNGGASSASFISNIAFKSLNDSATLTKIIDTNYSLEGRKFVLSFYAQNCIGANYQFYIPGISGSPVELISNNNDDWERFNVAYNFPNDGTIEPFHTEITIDISGSGGGIPSGCLIDAVQLEEVSGDGYMFSYEDYHNSNSIYLKKAPDYYHCELYTTYKDDFDNKEDCETAGNFWRANINRCVEGGFEQCADFTLECGQDDVGCNLYSPVNGDPSIPGVVRSDDFCPEVCNGYDTYKQEATFFESVKFPEFFIPDNEKKCSAQNAGCSEFTNLDKLEEGGEAIEYYRYLRPCHKIDDNCATFYTWVGSEETGFQLVAHLLLDADSDGLPDNIYSGADAAEIFGDCDDYDDAISNPECNEFYSESNVISYRHYKNTISCSDGCHPYRKTKSSESDCVKYSFSGWDWGEWSASNECIYESLPEQGITCPFSQNNCYEYKGNTSHNVRKVIDDGFETADNNWGVGSFSSESLIRGGHSLKVGIGDEMNYSLKANCDLGFVCVSDDGCECKVNDETVCHVQKDEQTCLYKSLLGYKKTYFLSFWAKGDGVLTAKFSSAPAGSEFTNISVNLGSEWQEYSLGPVLVDWDMSVDDPVSVIGNDVILETLIISGFNGVSYVDNIILKEERDNLFLIKPQFWNVSNICNQDHNGNFAPQYMLGCKEYKSEIDKENVFLKSFSRLCSEDVIGCEALIDTFNSYNYLEEIFNLGDKSEIIVFADKIDFLVNNKKKVCKERDKGCMALGIAKYKYNMNKTPENIADDKDDLYEYKTIYKINNPDTYNDTLCLFNDTGCGKFSSEIMGDYYFKDPASQRVEGDTKICEYKIVGGQTAAGWYLANTFSGKPNCPLSYSDVGIKYAAKSCLGGGGNICFDDFDCLGGYCNNWTAVCPTEADGCTEYIDPISSISKNIVFNSDFTQDVDANSVPDGWHLSGGDYIMDVPIYLQENTVYSVLSSSDGAGSEVVLENCVDNASIPINLTSPDDSMDVSTPANGAQIISDESDRKFSGRFYTIRKSPISCQLRVSGNLVPDKFVKILKTGIYYNIDNSIDKVDCNGLVDYEKGCVLFNRREMSNNLALEDIIYDADRNTKDENTPQACLSDGTCDSNLLVKVKPTRTCGEWLYCKSKIKAEYEKADICTSIGLCNSLNDKGICDGFVIEGQKNQIAGSTISLSDIRDKSGYVKIGKNWAIGTIDGYYPFGKMKQVGEVTNVPNGNFEIYSDSKYPIGWKAVNDIWDKNKFRAIDNPIGAQIEGIDYPLEGRVFLKYSPSASIMESEFIDVEPGAEYVLSAHVNTINFHHSSEFDKVVVGLNIVTYDAFGNITKQQGGSRDISWCEDQNQPWFNGCGFDLEAGYGWKKMIKHFKLGPDTFKIKIIASGDLYWGGQHCCDKILGDGDCPNESAGDYYYYPSADCTDQGTITIDSTAWGCVAGGNVFTKTIEMDSCAGNAYIDDIKIKPALNIQDDLNEIQTCRLYPQSDSLSCDYYEDSGTRQKGLLGYCLEYDRYPGNKDACLLWYPIDKVKGDSIEEGGGYVGRFPVYYALSPGRIDVWEFREAIDPLLGECGDPPGSGPSGDIHHIFDLSDPLLTINGGVFEVGSNGLPTYGFSERTPAKGGYLSGSSDSGLGDGSGAYDGMLISEPFYISNSVDTIHFWRNVKMRGFDPNSGTPDAYYLEIRDVDDIFNVLETVEKWEPHSDESNHNITGELYWTVPDTIKGQIVRISFQIVGHGKDFECPDGPVDDHIAQIDDVYLVGSFNTEYLESDPFWVQREEPMCQTFILDDLGFDNTEEWKSQYHYYFHKDRLNDIDFKCIGRDDDEHVGGLHFILSNANNWTWGNYEHGCGSCGCIPNPPAFDTDNCGGADGSCCYCGHCGNCRKFHASFDEDGYFSHFRIFTADDNNDSCSWDCTARFRFDRDYGGIIAQVVSPTGQNKYWSGRVYQGSNYIVPQFGYDYNSDYYPFGSVVYPEPAFNPYEWDSKSSEPGLQPLYYEEPNTSLSEPYQPRIGQVHLIEDVKRLFAQSYGEWEWSYDWKCADDNTPTNGPDQCSQDCLDGDCQISATNECALDTNKQECDTDIGDISCINCSLRIDELNKCDDGRLCCLISGDCQSAHKCNGGVNDGNYCDPVKGNDCPGSVCVTSDKAGYRTAHGFSWSPPDTLCDNGDSNIRPVYNSETEECNGGDCYDCPSVTCDFCAVVPKVTNVKFNNSADNIEIINSQFVNLTFNSTIDSQQLPLVMYAIDWGDNEQTVVTGAEMRDRINLDNPHSLYHLYSYWDLKAKHSVDQDDLATAENENTVYCGNASGNALNYNDSDSGYSCPASSACCLVKPSVKIKDNWSWCNGGLFRNDCDQWEEYEGYIVVAQY